MNIIISNTSSVPLYEQIKNQIESSILKGTITAGEALPSIRFLAKELKVSIITTKKAYEELEKDGLIETIAGKGSFVANKNSSRLRELGISKFEDNLTNSIKIAKSINLSLDECIEILKIIYEEG
ncbi:GntR family transcriptional regulator [Clostridium sp.]|uniref:GntR family transcriptional regulator n=1 Tax=Clostridium sp. TaxID=1506 RepID=UPI003992B9ED